MRLIDADALITFLNKNWYGDVMEVIKNAPTVEITEKQAILLLINSGWLVNHDKELRERWERPQGEWIMQRHDLDGCFYTCSNCGRMIRVPLFIDDPEDNETLADYPFCHCGAKMKGGAE